MQGLKGAVVFLLLMKCFVKALAQQFYIKLTKFTRRSRGPKSFLRKFAAGCQFVRDMSQYNWDVIHHSRRCLNRLARDNARDVLVYGERGITEVLYGLTFEVPIRIKTIHESYQTEKDPDAVPIGMSATSRQKVIIASLVNIEERVKRLREMGVDGERIVLLNDGRWSHEQ